MFLRRLMEREDALRAYEARLAASAWDLLQASPAFQQGMAKAAAEHARGEFSPFQHRVQRPPVMTNAIAGPQTATPRGVRQ